AVTSAPDRLRPVHGRAMERAGHRRRWAGPEGVVAGDREGNEHGHLGKESRQRAVLVGAGGWRAPNTGNGSAAEVRRRRRGPTVGAAPGQGGGCDVPAPGGRA